MNDEPYYDSRKMEQDLQQGAISMAEEQGKWELDVSPYLDRVYHELLGETLNNNGTWVRDFKRQRIMNELGASEFVSEISMRISIHSQLSELEDTDIIEIASRGAEIYADKIEDNYEKWDIFPSESNYHSIAQRLFDVLYIALKIARKGGMKKHRERSKNPYLRYSQPHNSLDEGVL